MEVYSDQPGVQLYTGNFLPEASSGENTLSGKKGVNYTKQGAFCLETQNYPDAVNNVSVNFIMMIIIVIVSLKTLTCNKYLIWVQWLHDKSHHSVVL